VAHHDDLVSAMAVPAIRTPAKAPASVVFFVIVASEIA
jgi:hypothetical protein